MSAVRKILFALLSLVVVFAPIGIASAKTYDFTNVPLLHKAYEGYDDQLPADSPPDYWAELSSDEYTAISSSDNNRAEYSSGYPGEYDFHRFAFKINEDPSVISQLHVRHEGYGYDDIGGYGLELFVWNYASSSWESVGYHYASDDAVIEAANTGGFSDYIDAGGYLQLLAETRYHSASCPYLYAWNGTAFEFIADFNTPGGLGYYDASASQPYLPKSEDYVEIDGSQLSAVDEEYKLEIGEDQDEVTYIDQVKLLAVDHPQGTEIYTPTMIKFAQPYPFKVYTILDPRPPISAADDNGVDILPVISKIDRVYTEGEDFAWDTITLDPGDLSGAKEIKLVFNAYIDWPLVPTIAARYMSEEYRARVEVINGHGEWQEVPIEEPLGLPQAKPRTHVIDITDWFQTCDYRVRISYWEKVLFDYIAFDTSEDEEVLVSELDPVSADLHRKGVAKEFSPDGRKPLIADYYTTVDASGFEPFAGNFTRYGDVLPLLTQVDDKFVIMHAGDDISLAFNEVPVSERMERDYFLFSDAYYKLHFVRMLLGEDISSVEPLPFHGMSAYPYPDDECYPYDAEHMAYLEEYNTRQVVASPPDESGHHTIYTDYVKVEVDLASAGPDLVVSKSVAFDEYGNFTVSYNVTNQGTAPAGESTTAKYVDGSLEESQVCPALEPGESHSGEFCPEPLPSPCPCGGSFNVTVCADADRAVEESDEDNNCEMNVVECPCPKIVDPKQDSLYLDADGDGAASAGDILQYIAEIRNEGNATATAVTFSDTVDANTILMCASPYAPIASQGSITSCNPGPGGSLAVDLGDISSGGVATVTFYVKVGDGEFDLVSNQGIVRGGNFADNPTDDPDTPESDDSTDTPISPPTPSPAPAVPAVNHWGIAAMIAVFAALLAWAVRRRLSAS
jgi:uncharacterized repeat protein (TIGR01451 family)